MFTIKSERNQLLDPLQAISGIAGKRHTLPILANVLINKKESQLSFIATDLEIEAHTSVEGISGEGDGLFTVNAKKLQEILKSLPDGIPISIEIEAHRAAIKSGRSRFSLQTLAGEDFPRLIPEQGETFSISVPQNKLRNLIGQVQIAMAIQDTRFYLNGMLFSLNDGELKGIATDGHRMAHAGFKLDNVDIEKKYDVILPRKTVIELYRLLKDSEELVNIFFTTKQVQFSLGNVQLTSKLIDGQYPDYRRVMPPETTNQFTINRTVMMNALQRVRILTTDKLNGIRLIVGSNSLSINAINADQEEAIEELEISYKGEDLDLGFNINYLMDVLNCCNNELIEFHLNNNETSTLIVVPDDEYFKYVVMPMRI